MRPFFLVIFLCPYLLVSRVFAYDISSPPVTYLHNGEHQVVYLTAINPNLICLQEEHWLFWVYQAFNSQIFIVNASSLTKSFPVHVFLASDEEDLRNRSPWLHHAKQEARPAAFSLFYTISPALESFDSFDVFENSQIPLFGLHAHCIALLPSKNSLGSFRLTIGFESQLDISRLARLGIGLIIYALSSHLTHNIAFYYISGVSMSVLGSFLILLICGMRLFPKRTSTIFQGVVLLSGGALSVFVFCLDYIRSALWTFATNNVQLLIAYVGLMSFLSLGVLYWLSLPETLLTRFPRTQNILLLVLRFIGILFITSAPQLPNTVRIVDRLTKSFYRWLEVDGDAYMITTFPLFTRLIFGIIVTLVLHFISGLIKKRPARRRQRIQEDPMPPIPCAASSPCPWRPSGTGYYENDNSVWRGGGRYEHYWDFQALSPVQAINTSQGYVPQSFGYRPLAPRKMKVGTYDGIRTQDLLTDDEDDQD